jgi:type I restriction enzyme, S subunit
MIRLRFDPTKIIPDFVASIWEMPFLRQQIGRVAKSTNGIWKINQSDLKEIRVPVPDLSTQIRVVNIYRAQRSRIDSENEFLAQLQVSRTALAQELLSGRLRLPESIVARHRAASGQAA